MARLGVTVVRLTAAMPRLHRLARWAARRYAGRLHIAVVGVLFDERGRVLAAGHAFRDGSWSLPGGWMQADEDPHRAVEREIYEETALLVTAVEVVGCERQGTPSHPLRYDALTIAFRCVPRLPEQHAELQLSPELAEARWLTDQEAAGLLSQFDRGLISAARTRSSTR